MIPLGLRQGTTVCVHTSMDVEQQSDHKLKNPSGMGLLVLWSRVALFLSPWCGKKDVPTGVNLNQYAGSGHFFVGTAITSPCSAHRICLSSLSV